MSETFKYPDATNPTKTLTFESDAGSNGHLIDDKESIAYNQISDTTISGIRMTRNLGAHFNRYEYTAFIKS